MNHNNNNIPLDIISDILSRLPIRSIGRFKCVSKSWRCLISESQFVKMHLHRSIPNNSDDDDDNTRIICDSPSGIMLINPSQVEPPRDYDTNLPPRVCDGKVVGSCHGLVLVVTYVQMCVQSIFVCNPCTREHRELPKLNNIDTYNEPYFGGIGYDSYSDDYKVLLSANLFSLKNNSWKTPTNIPCDYHGWGHLGVFFEGSLYWIACHNTNHVILTFDLDTEQFLELPLLHLPPEDPGGFSYEHLFVMGTHLSIFLYGRFLFEHEVWVMKKQGAESVWTKSFVVVYAPGDDYVRATCLLKSGELLLQVDDLRLVLYNPMDGTTRDISPGDFSAIFYAYGYIESLVSPYRVHEMGLGEQ